MEQTTVRRASVVDQDAVIAVFDAALLEFERDSVPDRIARGDVWVIENDVRVCGAIMLNGEYIEGIAVRPRQRRQGCGSQLLDVALEHRDRLVAHCDERLRAFYEANGFECHALDDRRIVGEKHA